MEIIKLCLLLCLLHNAKGSLLPVVVNTWNFLNASQAAWKVLSGNGVAVDAVETGCRKCEDEQCEFTVGYGGSPDENGETTLDAMLMDGQTMNVGAVAGLRRVKQAVAVARKVLDHTKHSLLVGDLATAFAKQMGFQEEPLSTDYSVQLEQKWKDNQCQPNFWTNVSPDPSTTCGPYSPRRKVSRYQIVNKYIGPDNHDTIGMVAVDSQGNVAAGTSSNGANHKIPGRVGDSPIPGAGCYADGQVGAAAATGDGDVMMRFLPSFLAVEEMRRGAHPSVAAQTAIKRIVDRHPEFIGAIVVLRKDGKFGAACHGIPSFPYSVSNSDMGTVALTISCL